MDFLLVKKPTITLKPHFFEQMLQYEEILKKRLGFNLSKDWSAPFFNLEDEVLANTYLNTLQKGRKSPRASAAPEKTSPKKGSIQWHKKIKTVLPSTVLQHTEIVKSITSNKPFVSDKMSESQTLNMTEADHGHGDEDSKSVSTQKKPFKVILKSKSAKNFDDKGLESTTYDAPGTPSLSVSGHKTASSEITNIYSAQTFQQRPATMGVDSPDQKYIRRNNSLSKDLGAKDTDVMIKPFKTKDRPDFASIGRPSTDAEPERAKPGKPIKSEMDKIKDQLNIHYGNSKSMNARVGVKPKLVGDMSLTSAGFGYTQDRMPLNQLITSEAESSKDLIKTAKKGPIKPTYKMAFATQEVPRMSRQDPKRNMFNISSHGSGSLGRSGRRGVQSADKVPEEKKKDPPATHSAIRTIISTLDQRQSVATSSNQKQKPRPSNTVCNLDSVKTKNNPSEHEQGSAFMISGKKNPPKFGKLI